MCVLTVVSLMKSSCADLGVREAAGDQAEDVELALGQLVELLRRRRARDARELLDHALRDRRARAARRRPATVRTAAISCSGGSSLSTKPLAPARSAS